MAADEIGDDGKIEEGSLALLGMTGSGMEERATRRKLAGMGSSSAGPLRRETRPSWEECRRCSKRGLRAGADAKEESIAKGAVRQCAFMTTKESE